MSQSHGPDDVVHIDRRHPRGRFSWVRRLMQGQTRQGNGLITPHDANDRNIPYNRGYYRTNPGNRKSKPKKRTNTKKGNQNHEEDSHEKAPKNHSEPDPENSNTDSDSDGNSNNNTDTDLDLDSHEVRSGSYNSDQVTESSDNISTTPLKSIVSLPSTKSPSVLSDNNHDTQSYNASTAETSITASSHLNPIINRDSLPPPTGDRDSESIVTLASSSRRIRRRSLETNSSTVGIPPASIMERIFTQPNANNSAYATSGYATSAYANSMNPNDRNSTNDGTNDDANSYRDFDSSSVPESA